VANAGVISSAAWDAFKPSLNLAYDAAAPTRLAIIGRDGAIVNVVQDFIPSSLPNVLASRVNAVVTDASCGACHAENSLKRDKLLFGTKGSGHLGRRYDLGVCSACHNAAGFNPETSTDTEWETLDLKNVVHHLHTYGDYPQNTPFGGVSNIGTGFAPGANPLWAQIGLPGLPGTYNCRTCHDNQNPKILPAQPANRPAEDKDAWQTRITQQGCGSCHPVDFTNHYGNQPDNLQCVLCHGTDRSEPVRMSHATPYPTPNNPELYLGAQKVEYEIASVTVDANRQPIVKFRVKVDGTPLNLKALPANITGVSTAIVVAWSSPMPAPASSANGPAIAKPVDWNNFGTTTGRTYWNYDVSLNLRSYDQPRTQSLNAAVIASLTGPDADGYFTTVAGINPTTPIAFPADTTLRGVGMESYLTFTNANGTMNISGNAPFKGIDNTPATMRRSLVDIDSCNTCHERIGFHSNAGRANNPDYCAACHNTEMSSSNVFAGTHTDGKVYAQQPNNLKEMVHSIHAAGIRETPFNFIRGNVAATTGGQGPHPFEDVIYPAQISDCGACHKTGTYKLPASTSYAWTVLNAQPALTAAAPHNPGLAVRQGPATGACGSCHDSASAKAHFAANTATSIGAESCNVCHGPGASYEAHVD
jgi:OmcA/MtrC family decaheme c-type cytochrome